MQICDWLLDVCNPVSIHYLYEHTNYLYAFCLYCSGAIM